MSDDAEESPLEGVDNPLGIRNDQELGELLRELVSQDCPRVFALCEVAEGWRHAALRAWGLAFADSAVLYLLGERALGLFESPEHARDVYGVAGDFRVVWPDYGPMLDMTTFAGDCPTEDTDDDRAVSGAVAGGTSDVMLGILLLKTQLSIVNAVVPLVDTGVSPSREDDAFRDFQLRQLAAQLRGVAGTIDTHVDGHDGGG